MSRLIVISNRVSPPKADSAAGAQGGLAVALGAALREYRGLWFGWSGNRTDEFTGHIELQRADGVTTATIDLEDQDVDEYYNGYANRTLWPLFHYRIDLAEYDRSFDAGYQRVNERFADTVSPLIDQDDLVWIHDYHLIPLGQKLRDRGLKNRMGFFLHIPWPPGRLLVSLPDHQKLVRSLLAYDVIGFQTQEWLEAFRDYVVRELGGTLDPDGTLHIGHRSVHIAAYPIGIDFADFTDASRSDEAEQAYARLRDSAAGRKVLIGVDRLDYSKGLHERFSGYQRFLENNPDKREDVFLLQIAPPSRGEVSTYETIREELDALSGRINGEFAEIDWVPIRYVNQGYPRADLAGFYRASQIALITPLRDGMNLVAKEYVAAQDPDDPGVLILSRFAGAALQLKDALLVNPYSADEVSDAIKTALEMPREERIRRWKAMMESVEKEDVVQWRLDFVKALGGESAREPEPAPAGK
ncbi:alpha,alpha-trehalose-phosphate synthase (UDP-forming) [Allosphingosinicella vermicomposti]|uniref:alpha,alpha-trehalose-phosphate synthase (UDP-forming) n=1 Tax=Allosphingosinicella vermicomposti TaxID=614671 RepID=UPI000D10ADBC|nr:alpha,alpha-trehalose-phosphate synthase (UDP-forming) [Allosphingosinicella vermicomposti]